MPPSSESAPAAPSPQYEHCPNCEHPIPWSPGFTKRERMALDLMRTLLSNMPHDAKVNAKDVSGDAVSLADALIETLETM